MTKPRQESPLVMALERFKASANTLSTFTYNLAPLTAFYLSHAQYVEIVDAKGLREAAADHIRKYLHIGE